MPNLLVKPSAPDKDGRVHAVTPASAGWTYVGFEVYRLDAGKSVGQQTGDRETCLVMLVGQGARLGRRKGLWRHRRAHVALRAGPLVALRPRGF